MSDDIKEYENLYHQIFFTIVKNTQPEIFATTNKTITDASITDETKYYENFINSIKENYPGIFNSTTETITDEIRDIAWTLQLNNKNYSALDNTSLIVSDLMAFKEEKNYTDDELTTFIFELRKLINDAMLPKRTNKEAEMWLAEQEVKDGVEAQKEYTRLYGEQAVSRAVREAAEEREKAKDIKWQTRKAEEKEWADMIRKQDREIAEWWQQEQQKKKAKELLERELEFETLHRIARQKQREGFAASRNKRASDFKFRESLFARRGGSRRRKRKATRKLRKHYKSRKSSNKHIRRKK